MHKLLLGAIPNVCKYSLVIFPRIFVITMIWHFKRKHFKCSYISLLLVPHLQLKLETNTIIILQPRGRLELYRHAKQPCTN